MCKSCIIKVKEFLKYEEKDIIVDSYAIIIGGMSKIEFMRELIFFCDDGDQSMALGLVMDLIDEFIRIKYKGIDIKYRKPDECQCLEYNRLSFLSNK